MNAALGHATRRDAGFTIVEMAIATAVLVSILAFTFRSVTAVTSVNQYSENQLREAATARNVMSFLRRELGRTSLERDKKTEQPRFRIDQDRWGNQVITYQVITGARMRGNEVEPEWSTPITISLDAEKQHAIRRQGDQTRLLGTKIRELTYAVTLDNKILVSIATESRNPKSGKRQLVSRALKIKPMY